jgi:FAD/FMN-containing dehydrogenase
MTRFADALAAIVGRENLFEQGAIDDRYRHSMGRKYVGAPAYVARPGNTAEISAILRAANDARVPVTALGGGTGVVGGATALPGGLVLSLERMRRIEEVDSNSLTMIAESGVTIQAAHEAAEAQQLFFPLDLGARGTATIGGAIGTNAGGNRVIRWGMMRDMVLGLEAVLADGSVVSALGKAVKDNAGYNWKHLLIGSEGTLGIVTRAVLRLRPRPLTTATALLAIDSFESVVSVLRHLEAALPGTLSAFEVMWDNFYELVTRANAAKRDRPLPLGHRHYVLVESLGSDPVADPGRFEAVLGEILGCGDRPIAARQRTAMGRSRGFDGAAFRSLADVCVRRQHAPHGDAEVCRPGLGRNPCCLSRCDHPDLWPSRRRQSASGDESWTCRRGGRTHRRQRSV